MRPSRENKATQPKNNPNLKQSKHLQTTSRVNRMKAYRKQR